MSKDKYRNFEELEKGEDTHNYRIIHKDRSSHVTIIAPHGGCIELKTKKIAEKIADDNFNYYSFIGKKDTNCYSDLHITSTNFDEPKAIELVGKSEVVIAIHGCKDKQKDKQNKKINYGEKIFIGGLDEDLIGRFKEALENASLSIFTSDTCDNFPLHFKGETSNNICNRGKKGKGVQFELTKSFRDNGELCGKFITVVSKCLKTL